MTKPILRAVSLAASLIASTMGCDPPYSAAVQRPPPTSASPPNASITTAPQPPASSPSAPSRGADMDRPKGIASGEAGAGDSHSMGCPQPYTCDLDAWNRGPRPGVTEIFVQKGAHRLHLVAGTVIVRSYNVALGWGGMGPKKYEGDGVTPTGSYTITDRLDSKWHTFLGVSYPNLEDQRAFAARRGRREVPPGRGIGFGIAIHGHRKDQADGEHKKSDWTLGCIALDNPEIDEVASAVKRGTRVVIRD